MFKKRNSLTNIALMLGLLSVPGFAFLAADPVLVSDPVLAASDEAWLGVMLQELSKSLRESMDLQPHQPGVLVAEVVPKSPAQEAGIEEGDLLVSMDGKNLDSVEEAIDRVQGMKPGAKVNVTLLRDGQTKNVRVTLGTREDDPDMLMLETPRAPHAPVPPVPPEMDEDWEEVDPEDGDAPKAREYSWHFSPDGEASNRGFLGVSTMDLNEQLRTYFEVPGERGVLVTEVSEDSPAAKAGLLAGDILLSVNKSAVDSPRDLQRLIRAHDPEDAVELEVMRKGTPMILNAILGSAKNIEIFGPGRGHHFRMFGGPDPERIHRRIERKLRLLHDGHDGSGRLPYRISWIEKGQSFEI